MQRLLVSFLYGLLVSIFHWAGVGIIVALSYPDKRFDQILASSVFSVVYTIWIFWFGAAIYLALTKNDKGYNRLLFYGALVVTYFGLLLGGFLNGFTLKYLFGWQSLLIVFSSGVLLFVFRPIFSWLDNWRI